MLSFLEGQISNFLKFVALQPLNFKDMHMGLEQEAALTVFVPWPSYPGHSMKPDVIQAVTMIASIEAIKVFLFDLIHRLVLANLCEIDSEDLDGVVVRVDQNLVDDRFARLFLSFTVVTMTWRDIPFVALVTLLVRPVAVVIILLVPPAALVGSLLGITGQVARVLLIVLICAPLLILRLEQVLGRLKLLAVKHVLTSW